jgi:hypothetical protein
MLFANPPTCIVSDSELEKIKNAHKEIRRFKCYGLGEIAGANIIEN